MTSDHALLPTGRTPAFELLVHDYAEEYDHVPSSLMPLASWWDACRCGAAPFALHAYSEVGLRLGTSPGALVEERYCDLDSMADGCREAARRLAQGEVAFLRTSPTNTGGYMVFSDEDPVRCAFVGEGLPEHRPFPFWPSQFVIDTPADVAAFVVWAKTQVPAWLAPTGNADFDRARGRELRLLRPSLISDLESAAALAAEVHRHLASAANERA